MLGMELLPRRLALKFLSVHDVEAKLFYKLRLKNVSYIPAYELRRTPLYFMSYAVVSFQPRITIGF